MDKDIKLGIALPATGDTFPSRFVDSFFCLNRRVRHVYIRPQSSGPIDGVRENLVEQAKALGCTHLWMTDTDQVYPQNTLDALLAHNLPAVAAKVHRRYQPYDPILYRGDTSSVERYLETFHVVPDAEWSKGGLVEVDATGFGSVLLDMAVFDAIEPPYFHFDRFTYNVPVGEDVGFWLKLRQAGIRVFVDCDIKVGHIAQLVIVEESYWAYKQNISK